MAFDEFGDWFDPWMGEAPDDEDNPDADGTDPPPPPSGGANQGLLDSLNSVNPGWSYDDGGNPVNESLQQSFNETPLAERYGGSGQGDSGFGEWAERGIDPATMFDANGQMQSGWSRTENGYALNGREAESLDPTSGMPRSSGMPGFSLGPLLGAYPGQFQAPAFGQRFKQLSDLLGPAPQFQAPELPTIDPFSFEEYTPTTGEHVFSDPSFGFRKDIGEKALMNSRAAQGLLRTGGTLKDLLGYNQNFASQEFGNVDARRSKDYGMRRGNALENWRVNADTTLQRAGMDQDRARSMYEPKLFEWTQKGNLGARAEDKARDDAFQEFRTDFDIWRTGQNDIFDKLKWASEFGLDAATR